MINKGEYHEVEAYAIIMFIFLSIFYSLVISYVLENVFGIDVFHGELGCCESIECRIGSGIGLNDVIQMFVVVGSFVLSFLSVYGLMRLREVIGRG